MACEKIVKERNCGERVTSMSHREPSLCEYLALDLLQTASTLENFGLIRKMIKADLQKLVSY